MQLPRNIERSSFTLAWILFFSARHNSFDSTNPQLAATAVEAFAFVNDGACFLSSPEKRIGARRKHGVLSRQHVSPVSDINGGRRMTSDDDNDADETRQQGGEDHPMAKSSRLSHVMLKVPSVDKTVAYWKEQGGKVTRSSNKKGATADAGEVEPLASAFLELGCYATKATTDAATCFALELVTTKKEQNYTVGNVISHIGISRLLRFQADREHLRELLMGGEEGASKDESGTGESQEEPNGIPTQMTAAAPGDFFARFSLRSRDLDATRHFYTAVVGMKLCLGDENVAILRYDNECFPSGVPTTLVFERAEESEALVPGDCFDHLAIRTKHNIRDIYEHVSALECDIFMKPTRMFGSEVMGVMDPNGFKVVIAASR